MEELISEYQMFLELNTTLKENTIEKYMVHLRRFLKYLQKAHPKLSPQTLEKHISPQSLQQYLNSPYQVNKAAEGEEAIFASRSEGYQKMLISSLSPFWLFLASQKNIILPPLEMIKHLEKETLAYPAVQRDKTLMTSFEFIKVYEKIWNKNKVIESRNKTFFVLIYFTALSSTELLKIKEEDVKMVDDTLLLTAGEGHRRRTLSLPASAAEELKSWIQTWKTANQTHSTYLFCKLNGQRQGSLLTEGSFHHAIKEAARKAGIAPSRVSAMRLREAYIAEQKAQGKRPEEIARLLGFKTVQNMFERFEEI